MRRMVKKYFYPVGFAMMLVSSSAMAKVDPKAFYMINHFFNPNAAFCSLPLGATDIEVGILDNLLFNGGPYKKAFTDKGERNYIFDSSPDALWKMAKTLFPSNNGQLGTETISKTNFGKNAKDPKTLALLMNYANSIRNNTETNIDEISNNILKTMKDAGRTPDEKLQLSTIVPLLNFIKKSIEEEKEGKSIYPKGMTETVLSAFCCYQLNTQKELYEYMLSLDNSIVPEKDALRTYLQHYPDRELKPEDISNIKYKADRGMELDIDAVYDLFHGDIWKSITPYRGTPINNGNVYQYERKLGRDVKADPFSDCVETLARHLGNLLLFNAETRVFDLTNIEAHVVKNSEKNLYFDEPDHII